MPADRIIAQFAPYEVDLAAGEEYAWCRCGRSKSQPFCDGSHAGTGIEPLVFTAERNGRHFLCGCKHTKNEPLCDGAHNKL
jgi:CDGSH-type Zn-finger protein